MRPAIERCNRIGPSLSFLISGPPATRPAIIPRLPDRANETSPVPGLAGSQDASEDQVGVEDQ